MLVYIFLNKSLLSKVKFYKNFKIKLKIINSIKLILK